MSTLKTDYIDFGFIHCIDEASDLRKVQKSGIIEYILELKEQGDYGIGSVAERMNLYRRCEKEGVGISVMKAFSGGQLLSAGTSPFGKPLTEYQCIQYALDKPAVLTVLPGIRGKADLQSQLALHSQVKQMQTIKQAN